MRENTNLDRDTISDDLVPSGQGEPKRSLVVPAAKPTEPVDGQEPSISHWNWPTSGELQECNGEIDASYAPDTTRLNEPGPEFLVEAEQPIIHDTLPSPPPSTEYGE